MRRKTFLQEKTKFFELLWDADAQLHEELSEKQQQQKRKEKRALQLAQQKEEAREERKQQRSLQKKKKRERYLQNVRWNVILYVQKLQRTLKYPQLEDERHFVHLLDRVMLRVYEHFEDENAPTLAVKKIRKMVHEEFEGICISRVS